MFFALFSQIVKCGKNHRTRRIYINNDYADFMKCINVKLNSKHSKQKTKKTHDEKTSFPNE